MNDNSTNNNTEATGTTTDTAETTQTTDTAETTQTTDTAETTQTTDTGAARHTGESDAATPEGDVWSGSPKQTGAQPQDAPTAPRTAAPHGVQAGTLVWGLTLLVLGGLLLAVAMGTRIDLVTAVIVLLAGLGLALLVMALLPHRRPVEPGS
ncbi:hypothetical protein [Actinomyces qiguomingii]|uniref:hypothetical protein n=1 Tax=Actinomyces qiguomingii TaxID=2057800 RepID=UPI001304BD1B|nr:hypothetical protein [Actinomyces qiguomingii]